MGLKLTEWTTRTGKRRAIRLYKSWRNLNDRVKGHNYAGNGSRPWFGAIVEWANFGEFRAWALAHGYSKTQCSLDRENSTGNYGPHNCRWMTVSQNTSLMNGDASLDRKIEQFQRTTDFSDWTDFDECLRLYA